MTLVVPASCCEPGFTHTYSVQQLQEELADLRSDLRSVRGHLAVLSLPEDDDAMRMEKSIRDRMYDSSVKIRKLLSIPQL